MFNGNTTFGCPSVFDFETQSEWNIDLIASDGNGGRAVLGIRIDVLDQNDPPTIDAEILPVGINLLEGATTSIDVSLAASDQDGDTLGYRFAISNTNVATFAAAGSVVTVSAVAPGTATLSLIVLDGTHTVTKNLPVKVKNSNTPPSFVDSGSRVTFSVFENSLKGTPIGDVPEATDPDQDVLSYEITGDGADVFAVTNAGKIIVAKQSGLDYETRSSFDLTLTALDGFGGSASIGLGIIVLDANDAPKPISAQPSDVQVGLGGSVELDVYDYFSDPDGDALNISTFSHAESVVTVSIQGTSTVAVTGQSLGSTYITITVDDGSANATVSFKVIVVPNAPPTIANPIDDMQIALHRAVEIPLANVFEDPDGDETVDVVSATSSDESVLLANVLDQGATLWLFGRNLGEASVEVIAQDNYGGTVTLEISVTVEGRLDNEAPEIAEVLEDVFIDNVGTTFEFSVVDAFSDEDEVLEYAAISANESVVLALIVEDNTVLLLSREAGEAQITVTATDSQGLSASQEFMTFVGAEPPQLIELAPISLEERTFEELDLNTIFDGGTVTGDATSSNTESVEAILWDDNQTLAVIGRSVGESLVSVDAIGEGNQRLTAEVSVTVVEASNTQPTLIGSLDGEIVVIGNRHHVHLRDIFIDPDGDELTFTVVSANENMLNAEIEDQSLFLAGVYPGLVSIKLQAADVSGLATRATFTVAVESSPSPSHAMREISLEVGGPEYRLNLNHVFTDIDNNVLMFDVVVSHSDILNAKIETGFLVLSAVRKGVADVQFNARDPRGRTATQVVTVRVGDSMLKASAEKSLAAVGRTLLTSVSSTLADRFASARHTNPSSDLGFVPSTHVGSTTLPLQFGHMNSGDSLDGARIDGDSRSNDLSQRHSAPQSFSITLGSSEGFGQTAVWFSSNRQQFEGEEFEGEVRSSYLGIDSHISNRLLIGATVANNVAEGRYQFGSAMESYSLPLRTIIPYAHYSHDGNTSAWVAMGVGSGALQTVQHTTEAISQDLRTKLGLLGFRQELIRVSKFTSGVKGEYGYLSMSLDPANTNDLGSIEISRVRLVAESIWDYQFGERSSLSPYLNIGLADERGDGQTGLGIETEAGLRLVFNGLEMDLRMRQFDLNNREGYSNRGVNMTVTYRFSESGVGPFVTVAPSWGNSTADFDPFRTEFLNRGLQQAGTVKDKSDAIRVSYTLGYGIRVLNDGYLLKPQVSVEDTEWNTSTARAGVELKRILDSRVDAGFGISVVRKTRRDQNSDVGLEANYRIQF